MRGVDSDWIHISKVDWSHISEASSENLLPVFVWRQSYSSNLKNKKKEENNPVCCLYQNSLFWLQKRHFQFLRQVCVFPWQCLWFQDRSYESSLCYCHEYLLSVTHLFVKHMLHINKHLYMRIELCLWGMAKKNISSWTEGYLRGFLIPLCWLSSVPFRTECV